MGIDSLGFIYNVGLCPLKRTFDIVSVSATEYSRALFKSVNLYDTLIDLNIHDKESRKREGRCEECKVPSFSVT